MLAFSTLAYSPFSPQAGPAANKVQEKMKLLKQFPLIPKTTFENFSRSFKHCINEFQGLLQYQKTA